MKIESLVNECLIQHEGGEKFFDAIDERLRNDNLLMSMMITKIIERESFDYLIVSGRFGHALKEFCKKNINETFSNNIIAVNGNLRNDNISYNLDFNIKDKSFIFIDDSFYLGRTRDKIKDFIELYDGNLICTYVFYDGSKEKDSSVHSFYRYYDNFKSDD